MPARSFSTGSAAALDPLGNQGRYLYINVSGTQRFQRFDLLNRVLEPWCYFRYTQGAAVVGSRLATMPFIDGTTTLGILLQLRASGQEVFDCLLQR